MSVKMDMIIGYVKQNIDIINSMDYTSAETKVKMDALANKDAGVSDTSTDIDMDDDNIGLDQDTDTDNSVDTTSVSGEETEDDDDEPDPSEELDTDIKEGDNDYLDLENEDSDDSQDSAEEAALLQESFKKEYSDEQFQKFVKEFEETENKDKNALTKIFSAIYMKDDPKIMCSRYGVLLSLIRTVILGSTTTTAILTMLRSISPVLNMCISVSFAALKSYGSMEYSDKFVAAIKSEISKVNADIKKHPNKKKELEEYKKALEKAEKRAINYNTIYGGKYKSGKAKYISDQVEYDSYELSALQESFKKEYSDEQFQQFIKDFKESENKDKNVIEKMFSAIYMKDSPAIMCSRYATILSTLRTFLIGDITAGIVQNTIRIVHPLIYVGVQVIVSACKNAGGKDSADRLVKAIQSELKKVNADIKKHPNKKKELESFKKCLEKAEKRAKNYKSFRDGKGSKLVSEQDILDVQNPVFEAVDDSDWQDALTEFYIQLHEYNQVSDKLSVLEHTSSLLNEDGLEKTKEMVGKLKQEKETIWKKIINSILKLWEKFKANVLQRYDQKVKYLKENIKYINMDRINAEISMPTIDHEKIDNITIPDLNYNAMKSHLNSEEDFMKSQLSWKEFTPQKDGETIASKIKEYVIDTNNMIKNSAELDPSVLYTGYCARFINIMDEIKKDIDVIKKGEKRADQLAAHVNESAIPSTAEELYFNEAEEEKKNDSFQAGDDNKDNATPGGEEQKTSSDGGSDDVTKHLQVYFKTCGKVLAAKMTVSQKVFKEYYAFLNWHISKKKAANNKES